GSGIYKTTDGGRNFRKLAKGLPTCQLGRIGLDYYAKNPNVLFAVIDSAKIGTGQPAGYLGIQGENATGGAKLTVIVKDAPSEKAGLKAGDIVKKIDGKDIANYEALSKVLMSHRPGEKVTITVERDKETKEINVTLGDRTSGQGQGRNTRPFSFWYGGQ